MIPIRRIRAICPRRVRPDERVVSAVGDGQLGAGDAVEMSPAGGMLGGVSDTLRGGHAMLNTNFVDGAPVWVDLGAPDVARAAEF